MSNNFPITFKGYDAMEAELADLKRQRPIISEEIGTASDHGDLKENAEYHAAREKQSFVEGRIAELEDRVARADKIDITKLSNDNVKFGATVRLMDDDTEKEITYQIVSEYESDLTKNRISVISPLARAIIGKEVGDIVEVRTPGGEKAYEVLQISYI